MVELRHVSKHFGIAPAVHRVDLRIESGEFLTLLGPSGCGKTTLLRMIGGFETPTEGTVWLDGRDVTSLPPYRRDVNQVFQSYALFPHLTVAGNIAFGLKMKRVPRAEREQRTQQAVELVSLQGLEHRKPSQLSGGQRQRVALARALVCQPKVLLLDEPLAALDAKLRSAMQIELKRLQQRLGITFIFVTHDQSEALVMSDRIAVMKNGAMEQVGTACDVYHRPQTPFVADFLGQANLLPASSNAQGEPGLHVTTSDGSRLRLARKAVGQPVFLSVRPERIIVTSDRTDDENTFPAVVHESLFRGALTQLLLELDGGIRLSALTANADSSPRLQPGDRVFCQIPADALVCLPA